MWNRLATAAWLNTHPQAITWCIRCNLGWGVLVKDRQKPTASCFDFFGKEVLQQSVMFGKAHTHTHIRMWWTPYCTFFWISTTLWEISKNLSWHADNNIRWWSRWRGKNTDIGYEKRAEQDEGHVRAVGARGEAQMSIYVADKVRANRAGIKNLFQNPDGSSTCGEPAQREGALETSTGVMAPGLKENYKSFPLS